MWILKSICKNRNEIWSHKLYLNRKTNDIQNMLENIIFWLLSSFTVEQSVMKQDHYMTHFLSCGNSVFWWMRFRSRTFSVDLVLPDMFFRSLFIAPSPKYYSILETLTDMRNGKVRLTVCVYLAFGPENPPPLTPLSVTPPPPPPSNWFEKKPSVLFCLDLDWHSICK